MRRILDVILKILVLPAGIALFYCIASLQHIIKGSVLVSVLVEEGCKLAVFIAAFFLAGAYFLWPSIRKKGQTIPFPPEQMKTVRRISRNLTAGNYAFAIIICFAVWENIRYFISIPGTGIFMRFFTSFSFHLITGLIYLWALTRNRPLVFLPTWGVVVGLHFAFNTAVLFGVSPIALALICTSVLVGVFIAVREIITRSIFHAE